MFEDRIRKPAQTTSADAFAARSAWEGLNEHAHAFTFGRCNSKDNIQCFCVCWVKMIQWNFNGDTGEVLVFFASCATQLF